MNLLIGVSGATNTLTRECVQVLRCELNLMHINMRQPTINAIAGLLGEPAHSVQKMDYSKHLPEFDVSLQELDRIISMNTRILNPNFFIEQVSKQIDRVNQAFARNLFSGHIISGIATESEATWLRKKGGTIVHIYDYLNLDSFHALHEVDGDLVFETSTKEPPTALRLNRLLSSLRGAKKEAA